jgi:putative endonuclease
MFYVYILHSESKERIYIGKTNDLKRRIKEHNAGQNVSTKGHRPWTLIFYEAYINEDDARRRERYLKTTQGHQAIRRMLKCQLEQHNKIRFEYQGSTTG